MLNYEKSMKIPEKKCQKHEDTQNLQKTMQKMPSDHAQPPSYDQISVTMIKICDLAICSVCHRF